MALAGSASRCAFRRHLSLTEPGGPHENQQHNSQLVFWSGLIVGTGMAWCRPATEKAESTQLPAVFILPPANASALALEHFCAGRYREAEPLYRAALAGWERMAAVAARNGIVTAVNLGTRSCGRGLLRGGRIGVARLYPPGRSFGTCRLGQEQRGVGACGQQPKCTVPCVAATRQSQGLRLSGPCDFQPAPGRR